MIEKTLVLIKHDGVERGLVGEIIRRLERTGLMLIAMKMLHANEELSKNHYHVTKEWASNLFNKTKEAYEKQGKKFGFKDPIEYGKLIQSWNVKFLREGRVVALVLEGPHAVEIVRKIVGHTEPRQANPGTIRGDFVYESYNLADSEKRNVRNLVHASGDVDEAKREISLWFSDEEICK